MKSYANFVKEFLKPLGLTAFASKKIGREQRKLARTILYAFFFAMWQLFVMLGALGTVQVVQLVKVDPLTIQVMCGVSFGANFFGYICLALGIKKPEEA